MPEPPSSSVGDAPSAFPPVGDVVTNSEGVRYLAVSLIVRVPADFDRDAMEDAICQAVGCPGINENAPQHDDCAMESFGSCCTEDSEDAYRWLIGPDPADGEPSQPAPDVIGAPHPSLSAPTAHEVARCSCGRRLIHDGDGPPVCVYCRRADCTCESLIEET